MSSMFNSNGHYAAFAQLGPGIFLGNQEFNAGEKINYIWIVLWGILLRRLWNLGVRPRAMLHLGCEQVETYRTEQTCLPQAIERTLEKVDRVRINILSQWNLLPWKQRNALVIRMVRVWFVHGPPIQASLSEDWRPHITPLDVEW